MGPDMEPEKERFQIGEVSGETGFSIDTIRYYEKEGLLEKPPRSEGGFRLYGREAVEKLRFIKKARALGLTLDEIKGIMRCSQEGLGPCCDLVRRLFTKKVGEFEAKIKELQRMKRDLESLLSEWIRPREARKRSYAVCPQIEREAKRGSASARIRSGCARDSGANKRGGFPAKRRRRVRP